MYKAPRWAITFIIATWAFGLTMALGLAAKASADPFDQHSFPCQEDEVLGYAPQFGPDRVGCIHIDDLKKEA
jgi:hypothetical protein